MNVLISGSGGREHAIAWKISKSSMIKKLIVCPGNAGTELVAKNIELDINDFKKLNSVYRRRNRYCNCWSRRSIS